MARYCDVEGVNELSKDRGRRFRVVERQSATLERLRFAIIAADPNSGQPR